ncbi:MAG TPA: hypothetical protein VIC57_18275 [Candidatus Dormibacteraeota bacterium]
MWSASEAAQRAALTGHEGPVNAIAISPGGSWLASAGDDGTVRLWRVPARRGRGLSFQNGTLRSDVSCWAWTPRSR